MAERPFPWVPVLYTLSLYDFALAAASAFVAGSPWPAVFGALAGPAR